MARKIGEFINGKMLGETINLLVSVGYSKNVTEFLRKTKINSSTFHRWVTGVQAPREITIKKIAETFGLSYKILPDGSVQFFKGTKLVQKVTTVESRLLSVMSGVQHDHGGRIIMIPLLKTFPKVLNKTVFDSLELGRIAFNNTFGKLDKNSFALEVPMDIGTSIYPIGSYLAINPGAQLVVNATVVTLNEDNSWNIQKVIYEMDEVWMFQEPYADTITPSTKYKAYYRVAIIQQLL